MDRNNRQNNMPGMRRLKNRTDFQEMEDGASQLDNFYQIGRAHV